jgi:hypothetical protein
MNTKIDFTAQLADTERYRAQIRKLFDKLKLKQQLFATSQEGVEYFSIGLHEADMASLLRNAVLQESYFLQAAKEKTLVRKNKQRRIYLFAPTDKLVIATLMQLLSQLAEQRLADNVYSYRPGRTVTQPVAKLASVINQQLASHAGLYVFKTDFADYSDCIRLDEGSMLWTQLRQLFANYCVSQPTAYQWQLIQSCFRPVFYNSGTLQQTNIQGLPIGSSSNTLGCNLYAIAIDDAMQQFPDVFYVRFSDDIVLAHTDRLVIEQAITQLHDKVKQLGLKVKLQKEERLYISPSAIRCEQAPEWRACNKFTYLGHDIYGNGSFLISTARQRKLLRAINSRIKDTALLLQHKDNAIRGATICKVVNAALLDENFAEREIDRLLQGNNQQMLRHLDYLIALRIAESITQLRGPRAFRYIPYQRIREEWHLQSLLTLSFR